MTISVAATHGWYDFTVETTGLSYRYAGRVETQNIWKCGLKRLPQPAFAQLPVGGVKAPSAHTDQHVTSAVRRGRHISDGYGIRVAKMCKSDCFHDATNQATLGRAPVRQQLLFVIALIAEQHGERKPHYPTAPAF